MATVRVLKTGYAVAETGDAVHADCTITLVRSTVNVLVDTGNPADGEELVCLLAAEGLSPSDIGVVVCTHGHTDHTGGNVCFPRAQFIVGQDISRGDLFTIHDFARSPYVIDNDVQVIPTPGHSGQDVSVLVKTAEGLVAVVGDLFENEDDRADPVRWRKWSLNPRLHARSRESALGIADFIVPGHGGMFRVGAEGPEARPDEDRS